MLACEQWIVVILLGRFACHLVLTQFFSNLVVFEAQECQGGGQSHDKKNDHDFSGIADHASLQSDRRLSTAGWKA